MNFYLMASGCSRHADGLSQARMQNKNLSFKLFLEWHRRWYLLKPWQAWHFMMSMCLFAV